MNTGSFNVRAPRPRFAPPSAEQGYRSSANEFVRASRTLVVADPNRSRPICVLSAFAVECALKAFLAKAGMTEDMLGKKPFGHCLTKLWEEAVGRGLSMPAPEWLAHLELLTGGRDFYARYATKVHGSTFPNLQTMIGEIERLVASLT